MLGNDPYLCTPHHKYFRLGKGRKDRIENYSSLFVNHVDDDSINVVILSVKKGMVIGYDRFNDEIYILTGRRLKQKSCLT